jgi:hypothetical protein
LLCIDFGRILREMAGRRRAGPTAGAQHVGFVSTRANRLCPWHAPLVRVVSASGLVLLAALGFVACGGGGGAADPFGNSGEGGAAGAAGAGNAGENEGGSGPVFGEPCVDDPQCDDGLDCTVDACDLERGRCRYVTDDAACSDGVYCNGAEVCDTALGCRPGGVVTCSDGDTCTIDTCIEESQSCRHDARDADGDGDPVWNCTGGSDCDDADPLISSEASERCGNGRDDDCDGEVDEDDCATPEYDTCSDALEIEAPGNYKLTFRAAATDYALSCAEREEDEPGGAFRDLVLALIVPEGPALDLDVSAVSALGELALAATDRCGSASGETQCEAGFEHGSQGSSARLILRGAEPGAHGIYLAGTTETDVFVNVDFREMGGPATNETCGTALPLPVGRPTRATLASVARDAVSACEPATGDLFYRFTLAGDSDVRITAFALDDLGTPVVSLRNADCSEAADELTCRSSSPAELYARSLPAGEYFVALAATGPSDVEIALAIEPPSEKRADEGCSGPEPLGDGERLVSLLDHTDAVQTSCLAGAADATYALELEERSDVLLVARAPADDRGAVSLFESACSESARLACATGDDWPLRTVAHAVGPGELRAVVETAFGVEAGLRAFTRPASPTTLVHRSDECADAVLIPETGGRFEGNTDNSFADYDASCDFGGQPAFGAPEQMLRIALAESKRVIFDLGGSDYDTIVVLREASECPGTEVVNTCVPGYVAGRSFLETTLEAGEYWVQIDGFNGESGRWSLEVFVASP